jgi:hypothetical protein
LVGAFFHVVVEGTGGGVRTSVTALAPSSGRRRL